MMLFSQISLLTMKSHSFPIAIIAALAHAHDVPVVDTTSGSLIGFSPYPDVHAYFNIPFAAPPIGDLRFAPPKQFQPISKEPRDTTQLGPACYQITHLSAFSDKKGGPPESEDCLTINIWKPATATGKLPVLIWLYPGGFSEGGNSDAANNGQRFVAEQKDIIVVTVKYVNRSS